MSKYLLISFFIANSNPFLGASWKLCELFKECAPADMSTTLGPIFSIYAIPPNPPCILDTLCNGFPVFFILSYIVIIASFSLEVGLLIKHDNRHNQRALNLLCRSLLFLGQLVCALISSTLMPRIVFFALIWSILEVSCILESHLFHIKHNIDYLINIVFCAEIFVHLFSIGFVFGSLEVFNILMPWLSLILLSLHLIKVFCGIYRMIISQKEDTKEEPQSLSLAERFLKRIEKALDIVCRFKEGRSFLVPKPKQPVTDWDKMTSGKTLGGNSDLGQDLSPQELLEKLRGARLAKLQKKGGTQPKLNVAN